MEVLYFLFFVLLGNFISSNIGLRIEKIISGSLAEENDWKHVVAIMYNPQEEAMPDLNPCTGVIIGDLHIATVAHCFYNENTRQLMEKEYYVATSIIDLWDPLPSTRYIKVDLLFIPKSYDPRTPNSFEEVGNLAVIRLAAGLGLGQGHRALKKLRVSRNRSFSILRTYTVAGFGWNQIGYATILQDGVVSQIFAGASDGKLRYAEVDIIDQATCQTELLHRNIASGNMCAKIRQESFESKGICRADDGAPLFRNNYLFGLAIHGFRWCNESQLPGIYLSVPYYYDFIENAMSGNLTENMRVLQLWERLPNVFEFVDI